LLTGQHQLLPPFDQTATASQSNSQQQEAARKVWEAAAAHIHATADAATATADGATAAGGDTAPVR
jgi:hypothetical protein